MSQRHDLLVLQGVLANQFPKIQHRYLVVSAPLELYRLKDTYSKTLGYCCRRSFPMSKKQDVPRENHPTVGESAVVDTLANQLLPTLLPIEWRWRAQSPDYFVDYHVEIVEEGELTGFQFGIQIKGTAKAKRRNNWIPFPMHRKSLAYYRDNARLPVFVALVDTTTKTAYWLFAQKYLREHASKAKLDSQNSLTLRFNPADSFSDSERFQKVLKEAEQYLRNLFPGTPDAAVSARQRELQAVDPEIGVKVSFTEGHEVLNLFPQKPLLFSLRSLKPEASCAYQAMLEHGEIFEAEVEITPPASPLLQQLMSTKTGLLHFEPEARDGCMRFVFGTPSLTSIQVDGQWRGGTKSARFNGKLLRTPLSVDLRIDFDETRRASFGTPLNLHEWENQWLLRLPWFSEVHSFVSALSTGQEFRVNYYTQGTEVGGFVAAVAETSAIRKMKKILDWLEKCRFVAKHYNVDVILPKLSDITYFQEREVEALRALATGRVAEDSITGQEFPFSGGSEFRPPNHWQSSDQLVTGTIRLIGTAVFDFLGHPIEVSDAEHTLTNMELISFEGNERSKTVTFRGRENSVWLRKKVIGDPQTNAMPATVHFGKRRIM